MMNSMGYAPVECLHVPKILFRDPEYRRMSVDAKVLYALLLDRMNVAAFNGWIDDYGTRYVIYPKSEMKKDLNATRYRVDMALEELYQKEKMVVVTQPYPGKPCQIYVKDITGKIEEDNKEMNRNVTDENMKNMCREQLEKMRAGEQAAYDQEEVEEICKMERSIGMLMAILEIAEHSAELLEKYNLIPEMPLGLEAMKELLARVDSVDDEDDEEYDEADEAAEEQDVPRRYSNLVEKDFFEKLYKRKMIDSKGQPNTETIHWRSQTCAMMLAIELNELDYRHVINSYSFMAILNSLHEDDNYDGIIDVMFLINEIFDFEIEEMEDFVCLRGETVSIYIDEFLSALKKELGIPDNAFDDENEDE